MEKIRIGSETYQADVRHAGKTLSLTFEKTRIEEIVALLDENRTPEVTVLALNGTVKAIYRNHALTQLNAETIRGVMRVTAVLQTEEIEQTAASALQDEVNALKAENEMLTACVLEMSEMVYA